MRLKRKRGQALIETIVGLFIFVPVVLFLIDVIALVMAQTANDALAKDCARAAAEEVDQAQAQTACNQVKVNFSSPVLRINTVNVTAYSDETVTVVTNATFTFPVAIPMFGVSTQEFGATATEPVVGKLSN